MIRAVLLSALAAGPAVAEDASGDLPAAGLVIELEEVSIAIGKVRIEGAIAPEDMRRLLDLLETSGAPVDTPDE
ncbi:hypothetical protein MWU52_16275 [Jannaschia sp. S6380]|uniref:hypothetical protein n=1 Tax=Jannaschia sp. S6380 TaxID=2926408 RepID=UPI001FF5ABED|nr:hypothetical protein [Jannaschia sp. S6380]MCK0169113.1 hypothetical protein [Jannaschia sp. S6380]